jgi:hypothetical protein
VGRFAGRDGNEAMTLDRREALVDEIVQTQPALRPFVRDISLDFTSGNWDLVSYSFERGFEALWDAACASTSGLLDRPLLSLWRQSVELAIKSAIIELAGQIDGRPGHDLAALFRQLLKIREEAGCEDDDELAKSVIDMIDLVQSFDPFADRFRYPSQRNGQPYVGFAVDLDELFRAHWIITTWCEGAVMELKGDI